MALKQTYSPFQQRFTIPQFYSAEQIREAIKECFPKASGFYFKGLDDIQRRDDYFARFREFVQARITSRDGILDTMIPDAAELTEDIHVEITERRKHKDSPCLKRRKHKTAFIGANCGYLVDVFD